MLKNFMKKRILITVFMGLGILASAQDPPFLKERKFSLTVSIFAESVSMPRFGSIFRNPHVGVRVGTEMYYSNRGSRRLFETFTLGHYHLTDFQNGLFASSDFGCARLIQHTSVYV